MKLKSMLWSLLAVLAFSVVGCSDDDDVVAPDPQPEGDAPVLTVNAASVEVAAEGGEQSFTFKVDHATDASVVAACAADWVEVSVKESRTSFDGTVSLVVKANEAAEARETSVKLSYKGAKDASVAVKQAGKEQEKPEVPQQDNKGEVVELTAETFAQWIYDYKTDAKKENFLSDIPAVIDFYGPGCGEHLVPIFDELAKEYNGKINFFRFNFTKPEHKVVKDYMGVTLCPTLGFMQKGAAPVMLGDEASNAITTNELMRAEIEKHLGIKSDVEPQPEIPAEAPQFELRGAKGDSNGQAPESFYTVFIKANTCVDFYSMIFPTQEIVEMDQNGFNLSQMIFCLGKKQLDGFCDPLREGKEVAIEVGGVVPGQEVTFIGQVVDAQGARLAKRLDFVVNGESKDKGFTFDHVGDNIDGATVAPSVFIDGWVGDEQKLNPAHNMTFNVKSSNALKVRYALFTKADYDDFLSKVPQEQLMIDLGQKLSPVIVKNQMNTADGWGISFSELPGGTSFVFIIWASNGAGEVFETITLMTEASGEGPKVEIEGWPGDALGEYQESKATFHVICREAHSMIYAAGVKKDIEGLLNGGWDVLQLLEAPGLGNVLDAERMQNLRSPEGEFFTYRAKSDQTFLYGIRNEAGDLTLGTYDVIMPK